MVPAGVRTLVAKGHTVLIQKGAGLGSGVGDEAFKKAGATIVDTADEVWNRAEMVVKVKEPIETEYGFFRDGQILYTYLHLAALKGCTKALAKSGVSAIGYETIQLKDGSLPLLRPMSQVAGRMAVQVGATLLEKEHGGKGILLGGVPGTRRGRVTIIGGGTVGTHAATIAVGMGAKVSILDINLERLNFLEDIFGSRLDGLYSDPDTVAESVRHADLLVGAVLVPGAKAPTLVSEQLVREMEPGSVIVDVAIDQGGCIETTHATTHDEPTYQVGGVIHYGVANMPGAVAHTSTFALTAATISYAVELAEKGFKRAVEEDHPLALGVNVHKGQITCEPVAHAHDMSYRPLTELL
jgi:alanine dehydrogenase